LRSLNQLIEASKAEERLTSEELAAKSEMQEEIIQATKTIAESLYAQQIKSLYVTPKIGKGLAKALKQMENAQKSFVRGDANVVMVKEAMKELNLVALDILQSLKKAAEGGSSTGMDQFMQNLSDIAQGQLSLNQSLSNFFPIPLGGLTTEQMAQMRRLAGKQRELREAMEALRSEAGIGKFQDLLDKMVDEMKKVEEELYQYKIDRELIERQRMIISRLLDAQKSIRKEDYHKERKSKPGKDFVVRELPRSLPEELGKDQLRELIQRALREPYPKAYELYIREYFKALLRER
jgi:hypothetical protein